MPPHGSGPRWLDRPSSWWTRTTYSLPVSRRTQIKFKLLHLSRYTHRVAIANTRLVSLADTTVAFRWKDYRHHGKAKLMTLVPDEFIRRFLLPDGFHRIRHYGFLANRQRAAKLALCRRMLDAPPPEPPAAQVPDAVPSHRPDRCPTCGGAMIVPGVLARSVPCRTSFWDDTS
jgi:hypothetical protein